MSSVDPLVRSFKRQRVAHQLLDKYVALSVFLDQYDVGAPNYLLRMSANPKLSKRAWERVMYHARGAFRHLLDQNSIDKDFDQSLTPVPAAESVQADLIGLIQDWY
jgi:hypothetical protein